MRSRTRRYVDRHIYGLTVAALVLLLIVGLWDKCDAAETTPAEDLQYRLDSVVGWEDYPIDERMVLVGVAWGYNVSRTGIVHFGDGATYDLRGVVHGQ